MIDQQFFVVGWEIVLGILIGGLLGRLYYHVEARSFRKAPRRMIIQDILVSAYMAPYWIARSALVAAGYRRNRWGEGTEYSALLLTFIFKSCVEACGDEEASMLFVQRLTCLGVDEIVDVMETGFPVWDTVAVTRMTMCVEQRDWVSKIKHQLRLDAE